MKLGFALRKSKKPVLQQAPTHASSAFASALPAPRDGGVEKVFVTDFDPHAPPAVEFDADGNAKRTLVIPLIKANTWKVSASGGDDAAAPAVTDAAAGAKHAERAAQGPTAAVSEQQLTADERAAKELLADAQSHASGGAGSAASRASNLVIPINSAADVTKADAQQQQQANDASLSRTSEADERKRAIQTKLFNFESQEANKQRVLRASGQAVPTAPILKQNTVPGMDALADVNDKYRLDVAMRPDALDVHSTAYELVPIEDFGAALLRGMGWKGSVDTDDKATEPKPRHKLLGLGATARPPMPSDTRRKHRGSRQNEKPAAAPSTSKGGGDVTARRTGLNHDAGDGDRSRTRDDSRRQSSNRDRRSARSRDDRDRDADNADQRRSSSSSSKAPRSRDDNDSELARRRPRSRDRSDRDRSDRDRSDRDRSDRDRSDSGRSRDHRDERRKRSRSRSRDDRSSDRKRSSRR